MVNVRLAHNTFLAYCTNLFGPTNGLLVYEFYRVVLQNIKGPGQQSIKRRKNLDNMLKLADHTTLLETIAKLTAQYHDSTCQVSINEHYFRKALEWRTSGETKFNTTSKTKNKIATKPSSITLTPANIITPSQHIKTRTEYPDEYLNWDYLCPCGAVIDPWKDVCPQCNSKFSWSKYAN